MKTIKHPLFLSILSALLLSLPWLGFSPWTMLVGWVPLLFLRDNLLSNHKKGFLWYTTLSVSLWYIFTTYWVSFATPIANPAIVLTGLAMMMPAWWLFHTIAKKSSRVLGYCVLISGWIVAEWWNTLGDISFPWLLLGGGWARDPYAIQWYRVLGQSGGTLWVMLCNVLVYETIRRKFPKSFITYSLCAIFVPVVISLVIYSLPNTPSKSIEVAVIQPNVDAYNKFKSGSAWQQTESILELSRSAPSGTSLYVAPETAIAESVNLNTINENPHIVAIQEFLRSSAPQALFIIGASSRDNRAHYNSILYITADAIKVYHKRKLVLGVETVPSWVAPFAEAIDMGGYVGSLGRSSEAMAVDGIGAVVCYESIYSEHFSQWIAQDAELMAIITNDGWWGDTHGYRQHFDFARVRAIETARWVVRSANTGISGVIDSKGNVVKSLGWNTKGVITATVELNQNTTLFVKMGDLVTRIAMYVLWLCVLYYISMKFRRKLD